VRIKGRRRDKGGEGGRSKSTGWEDQLPKNILFNIGVTSNVEHVI